MSGPGPAYLLTGDDPALVSQGLTRLLRRLSPAAAPEAAAGEQTDTEGAGSLPPALVEEIGAAGSGEDLDVGPVLDACSTPPLLSDRRVVVVRSASSLRAEQVRALAAYLASPVPTTTLVLVCDGGRAPAALEKAVRQAGEVIDTSAGTGRARRRFVDERARASGLRIEEGALDTLATHLGDDLGRLDGLLETLAAAYGERARVGRDELAPFLGEAGGVAPWDLTDALDRGDGDAAIGALRRLVGPGERHPVQIVALLHRHFGAMLRLDGSDADDEASAAELVGMRPFQAGKALRQAQTLGRERIFRAISLIAAADVDLRGKTGWPPELVVEVLVARLAQLARAGVGSRSRSGAGRRRAAGR